MSKSFFLFLVLFACRSQALRAPGDDPLSENTATAGKTPTDSSVVDPGTDKPLDTRVWPMGDPGCGLDMAAFCETFEAPSAVRGRAGDLDPTRFSAGRIQPQLPTGGGVSTGIPAATVPSCRGDLPAQVFPDQDTLVCDGTAEIESRHLLVVVGAQNYGHNSYRVRQPFDFTGRTGTVVFDAQGYLDNPLCGWISLEITEDPISTPSYSIGAPQQNNDEGGSVPKNALELQFGTRCADGGFALRLVDVLHDHEDTLDLIDSPHCVPAKKDHLNRFEVQVAKDHLKVFASAFSADGVSFPAKQFIYDAPLTLPFSRGYVHLSTHNHAAAKYGPSFCGGPMDAWTSRWDNVGFDGPVVKAAREYELPDAAISGTGGFGHTGAVMSVGYNLGEVPRAMQIAAVNTAGVGSARLAVSLWVNLIETSLPLSGYELRYRFNAHAWRTRKLSASEIALLENGHSLGQLTLMLEVNPADLVQGDNAFEIATSGVPTGGYPPGLSNVDLIVDLL